jgi:hypothetical protein
MIASASRRITGVFSVAQFRLGHIDGALMMGHHHRGEIVIDVSGHGCGSHAFIHLCHARFHHLHD